MPLPHQHTGLLDRAPLVLPSLLLCDFGHLADEVAALERAGVCGFHLDVMDGQFVPNLTYGMPVVEAVRRATDQLIDVHLMIAQPQRYIPSFRDAGADVITVHAESVSDAGRVVESIKATGAAAGLAINPATPLETIEPSLDACDLVLVMSVQAGFGGQQFDPVALEKLDRLTEWARTPGRILEIDGGINEQTIGNAVLHGAQWLVVGSAIFRAGDYGEAIARLEAAAAARPTPPC